MEQDADRIAALERRVETLERVVLALLPERIRPDSDIVSNVSDVEEWAWTVVGESVHGRR